MREVQSNIIGHDWILKSEQKMSLAGLGTHIDSRLQLYSL